MKPVATAAGPRFVERLLEMVLPQKPTKCPACVLRPERVARHPLCFEAGRHHRARFDGLLVERSLLLAAHVEAVGPDRGKIPLIGPLNLREPFERPRSYRDHLLLLHPKACR